jgi:hypothetical protein
MHVYDGNLLTTFGGKAETAQLTACPGVSQHGLGGFEVMRSTTSESIRSFKTREQYDPHHPN